MKKHTFVVIAWAPESAVASEIADHLADASRLMRQEYHESDPLAQMPDIQVLGMVRASELPPASCARADPVKPVPVHERV